MALGLCATTLGWFKFVGGGVLSAWPHGGTRFFFSLSLFPLRSFYQEIPGLAYSMLQLGIHFTACFYEPVDGWFTFSVTICCFIVHAHSALLDEIIVTRVLLKTVSQWAPLSDAGGGALSLLVPREAF